MKHTFEFRERSLSKSVDNCRNETSKDPEYSGIGIRHLQSLLLALAVFCGYLQRVNLSMTIVAITNVDKMTNDTNADNKIKVYDWDSDIRNYILSSFFVGYLVVNFPAALMGVHFNNKMLLTMSFLINGVISCITPYIIEYEYEGSIEFFRHLYDISGPGNWKVLIALRCFQGMVQAFLFPTIHAIIARWAPAHERSMLVGFTLGGIPLGTMITLAVSGILSSSIGWPSVFYCSGVIGFIWVIFWILFGSNSPSEDTHISTAERQYIYNNIQHNVEGDMKKVPWRHILTSLPVWAIVIAHTGHNWGYWLLLQEMPTFIHEVLNFNVKSDGLLSSLPYMGMWLLQFPVMYIADLMIKNRIISISVSRKLWNTIGMWGAGISLVVLGYLDYDAKPAIILYIIVVSISCCVNVGFNINHMDLTPNYAGILMGISNGFGASGGLGAPLLVAYLVNDVKSVLQWRMVFYAGAVIVFFSNLIFLIFGSGRTQKWNNLDVAS